MSASPDRTRVRISEYQGYVVVTLTNGGGAQATVAKSDGYWTVTFLGVTSKFAACDCTDRDICSWPTADCYRGVQHIGAKCHGWHAARACVAAAALLIAHADRTVAVPPPEGRFRRRNVVVDTSVRQGRREGQRYNPWTGRLDGMRGGDA